MFKFRGLTVRNDEWVEGDLIKFKTFNKRIGYQKNMMYLESEIYPESLSVTYTGLTDKNGNSIYASFEVDGKMSKGGDIIKCVANAPNQNEQNISKGIVQFNDSGWYLEYVKGSVFGFNYLHHIIISSIEIIGKQWEDK